MKFEWDEDKAAANLRKHGVSSAGRLLVISHVERTGHICIISARPATRIERKFYEEA
jgi:uncharacterized DUF497 family protein